MAAPKKDKPETLGEKVARYMQEASDALNPVKRATPAAQRTMESAKDKYGGGARQRAIDAVVDNATVTRKKKRK